MLRPENWINAEFANFVDEHDKVMTENFAERFIDHRNISLARRLSPNFRFIIGNGSLSAKCWLGGLYSGCLRPRRLHRYQQFLDLLTDDSIPRQAGAASISGQLYSKGHQRHIVELRRIVQRHGQQIDNARRLSSPK
jgi:hypothetical protein